MHTSSIASSFVAHPEMAGEQDDEELITPDALIKQTQNVYANSRSQRL
jgi:hypothetical protein